MEQTKENKMGVMPVNKLLITMSLPMMISMLVQALYNVVDSIFVSRINENALTAVSLAFPVQTLMIALGAGTGVGINAALSRFLGAKEFKKVNKVAVNGIFLGAVTYVLFALAGAGMSGIFYRSQTSDPQIVAYGIQYMQICCICSVGLFMQFVFERLLLSTGKTVYTMITQGTGAIINIIFDPILIFGLFGFPKMGVAGAAAATVAGQIVAGSLALFMNLKVNHEVSINLKGFRPDWATIKEIYIVGIPSIIMQAIGSVMTYGMNKILISFTSTAAAVFGVYFKLQSFVFMPVFGLNNGVVPIIAYNYGAGNRKRMLKTVKLATLYAACIMAVGVAIFQLLPTYLFSLFKASETMLAIGVPALRIISLSFLFAAFGIVSGSVFQALGNGVYSMLVSLTRQLIVLLPVAYLLGRLGNVTLVWWAFPIAELFSFLLSVFFLVRINRKIICHIPDGRD